MGLSTGGTRPVVSDTIFSKLNSNVRPIIDSNRKMGAENLPGGDNPEKQFDLLLDQIRLGQTLLPSYIDNLRSSAIEATVAFNKIQDQITLNDKNILKQEGALARATSEEDKSAERKRLDDLLKNQTGLGAQAAVYANRLKIINAILGSNVELISEEFRVQKNINTSTQQQIKDKQILAELENSRLELELSNIQKELELKGGGVAILLNRNLLEDMATTALKNQIELTKYKYDLQIKELELKKLETDELLKQNTINKEEHDRRMKSIDAQIKLLEKIKGEEIKGLELDKGIKSAADFKESLLSLTSIFANAVSTNLSKSLQEFLDKLRAGAGVAQAAVGGFKMAGKTLKDVAAVAFVGAFEAMGDAFVEFLTNGGSFLKALGKFFGEVLITIGKAIIKMALANIALAGIEGFKKGLPGGIWSALGTMVKYMAMATVAMAPLLAIGTGLVLLGSAMGGGGGAASKDTANANASGSANSNAGATGEGFDPKKDPKTIYQKALAAQILIDIRTDSGQIVKTVIKDVNNNGRLATLIGNRKLQFGY